LKLIFVYAFLFFEKFDLISLFLGIYDL